MPVKKSIAIVASAAVLIAAGGTAIAIAQPRPAATTPAQGAAVSYEGLAVTGYVEAYSTTAKTLASRSKKLTSVGIDGINFTADGGAITAVTDEAYALLEQAHRTKDRAELLVGNFDDELGDFSPGIAANLLDSPANQQATASALAEEVRAHGWDGIQVDLESLESIVEKDGGYTDRVTAYLALVRAKLDAVSTKKTLSVAIMATAGDYRDLGYDPAGIAKSTDSIVLMAYDQHGPWEKTSGPVGGLPWVKSVLAKLLKSVPRSEVQLGIAGYGYSWPGKGDGTQYSAATARAIAKKDGARVHWSATEHESYTTLKNGTRIWWSDARAVDDRVKLARAQKLGGVAVWSTGLADPLD